MSKTEDSLFAVCLLLMMVAVAGPFLANEITNAEWEKHLIEKNHAEWCIDPKTGERSFELYDPNC